MTRKMKARNFKLTPHEASALIREVIARAQHVNADGSYIRYVTELWLFGSALEIGPGSPAGDVDIMFKTENRPDFADLYIAAIARAPARLSQMDRVLWPAAEVRRALNAADRRLDIVEHMSPGQLGPKRLLYSFDPHTYVEVVHFDVRT